KTYDVFISHIGSEKTVQFCKQLLEYLENKWNFKTCLVERDLLAGAATCDNIVESVKDSRCFLLVLTPDYIQVPSDCDQIVSESPEYVKETHWRPYEFQIALEESLKLQTRIVIIKLEKLPANINMDHMKTLKHVIGVTRCLKWEPNVRRKQDKFWKNLLYQLPTSSKWRPTFGQLVQPGTRLSQHKSADDEKPLNRQFSDESGYGEGSPTEETSAPFYSISNELGNSREGHSYSSSHGDIQVSVEENKYGHQKDENIQAEIPNSGKFIV
ncbi:X-linked interleukin-1 receptor accessory protein-like 2, partial [Saccoglossus kowalevskii]